MDTLMYDGTAYVKASVLAKRFRYTADYIGQLCRSGKIDARLVGRSWYVNEAALLAYKEARYKASRIDEITDNKSTVFVDKTVVPRVEVRSRLSNNTIKSLQQIKQQKANGNFASRLHFSPVRYEVDEATLLPQPNLQKINVSDSSSPKRIIPIIPESLPEPVPSVHKEAMKIKVQIIEEAKRSLKFSDIPEVVLRGALPIVAIDEVVDDWHSDTMVTPESLLSVVSNTAATPLKTALNRAGNPQLAKISFTPQVVAAVAAPRRSRLFVQVWSLSVVSLGVAIFTLLTLSSNVLIIEGAQLRSTVDFNLANAALVYALFY